jgi:hypothetical protein
MTATVFIKKMIKKIASKVLNSEAGIKLSGRNAYYVLSHPKSGRTWLTVIISKVLSLQYGVKDNFLFDPYGVSLTVPYIKFMHGNSRDLVKTKDISPFAGKDIVHLVRDPRDVVVSYFYQITKRRDDIEFEGDLHDFIISDEFGITKIVTYLNLFLEVEQRTRNFLEIRYENLRNDFAETVKKVLDFMSIPYTDEYIESAREWSSFDNMKKLERADYFNSSFLKPKNADDPSTYKVRSGKIGGYREIVSGADQAYIDKIISRDLDDRYSQYKYTT